MGDGTAARSTRYEGRTGNHRGGARGHLRRVGPQVTSLLGAIVVATLARGQAPADSRPSATRAVSDVSAARHFYEALGCQVRRVGESTIARVGQTDVTLAAGRPPESKDDAVEILVASTDEARRRLGAKALRVEGLDLEPPSCSALLVKDPDGWPVILRTKADADRTVIPRSGPFDDLVIACANRFPTDGTHGYFWPKGGAWRGCTKNLIYAGATVCEGDPQRRAYCCGLTFEVFLDAWQLWCRRVARPYRIRDWDVSKVRQLQSDWFGSADDRTCVRTAIVKNGLGTEIKDWNAARPGDFIQFWRNGGSGHSVIFREWKKAGDRITGLVYWSTQKSTKGIGTNTEMFGTGSHDLKRDEFYLCRVGE